MKKTICDVQGYLKFDDIKSGSYYITTKVMWFVQGYEGGWLMQKVDVDDGKTKEVVLTD